MAIKLKICEKCGWYEHGKYDGRSCSPNKGAAVKAVLAAASGIEGSQLGYGTGDFAFTPDRMTLVFGTRESNDGAVTFEWKDVYCFRDLGHEDIVDLAKTLNDWSARATARKPIEIDTECSTCLGHGRIRDGETNDLRKCLDCNGSGIE